VRKSSAASFQGSASHVASSFEARPQNQIVASTLPADSAWSDSWKQAAIRPPRGYSFAALQLAKDRFLLAYSLHLKSNRGELTENFAMRHEAARQLLAHVEEMVGLYSKRGTVAVIVAGDMNTSLDDPRFQPEQTLRAFQKAGLHWAYDGVPMAQRVTIPASGPFPDNCFDHMFTAGLGGPIAKVKAFPDVSDHNPVILDLDLTKADFKPQLRAATRLDAPGTAGAKDTAASALVAGKLRTNDTQRSPLPPASRSPCAVRCRRRRTANGSIEFINFAGNERGQFVAIVRKEHQEKVAAAFGGD
jgi:endonuclease/exonuclease/phosphatase family metal-dependent hydrolase